MLQLLSWLHPAACSKLQMCRVVNLHGHVTFQTPDDMMSLVLQSWMHRRAEKQWHNDTQNSRLADMPACPISKVATAQQIRVPWTSKTWLVVARKKRNVRLSASI